MDIEQIYFDGHPSWSSQTGLLAGAIILLVLGVAARVEAFVLVAVALAVAAWIRRSRNHYLVSDRRIVVSQGLIERRSREITYGEVSAIEYTRRSGSRVATISLQMKSGNPVVLWRIPGGSSVREKISAAKYKWERGERIDDL